MRRLDWHRVNLRDVEELGQCVLVAAEDHAFVRAFSGDERDGGVEAFADGLVGAESFELDVDELADAQEMCPVFFETGDAAGDDVGDVREEREVNAGFAAFELRADIARPRRR